jgi:hypothetical protein
LRAGLGDGERIAARLKHQNTVGAVVGYGVDDPS